MNFVSAIMFKSTDLAQRSHKYYIFYSEIVYKQSMKCIEFDVKMRHSKYLYISNVLQVFRIVHTTRC